MRECVLPKANLPDPRHRRPPRLTASAPAITRTYCEQAVCCANTNTPMNTGTLDELDHGSLETWLRGCWNRRHDVICLAVFRPCELHVKRSPPRRPPQCSPLPRRGRRARLGERGYPACAAVMGRRLECFVRGLARISYAVGRASTTTACCDSRSKSSATSDLSGFSRISWYAAS